MNNQVVMASYFPIELWEDKNQSLTAGMQENLATLAQSRGKKLARTTMTVTFVRSAADFDPTTGADDDFLVCCAQGDAHLAFVRMLGTVE